MNINKLKGLLKERGYTYIEFVYLAGIYLTALQICLMKGKTYIDRVLQTSIMNVKKDKER